MSKKAFKKVWRVENLKIELPKEGKERVEEEFDEELDDAELALLNAIRKFAERELSGETNILISFKRANEEEREVAGSDSASESEE